MAIKFTGRQSICLRVLLSFVLPMELDNPGEVSQILRT